MDLYDQDKPGKGSPKTSLKGIEKTVQEILPNVVVGDRFHPNDQELVDYYLKRFILSLGYDGNDLPIAEVNVYKFEPWELPGYSKMGSNDQEWYFISPLEFMDKKKKRFNRKTKTGTWKPTGKTRQVLKRGSKKVIGSKRTLVFHKKGLKTEWVMHEYQYIPDSDQSNPGEFVAIKLKKKFDDKMKKIKLNDHSFLNCDNENVDSTCNDGAVVSVHCKSQSHNDNGMSGDSTSSSDIQSSITELELELEDCRPNTPPTPFLLEDEASLGKETSESLLLLEDHSANPKSLPVTVTDDVLLSVKELKDPVYSFPKISLALDDQSFVKGSVLDDQFCVSVVGDWMEDKYLEEGMNEANFTTSEMDSQTQELATLSEILDFF